MDNYEYLIAGLPVLSKDWSANSSVSVDSLIEEIKNGCSKKDNVLIDSLLDGYKEENFNEDFYKSMLRHKNSFIREFFTFDLRVRNAKVRYLNEQLGRNTDKDIFLETEGDHHCDAMAHCRGTSKSGGCLCLSQGGNFSLLHTAYVGIQFLLLFSLPPHPALRGVQAHG